MGADIHYAQGAIVAIMLLLAARAKLAMPLGLLRLTSIAKALDSRGWSEKKLLAGWRLLVLTEFGLAVWLLSTVAGAAAGTTASVFFVVGAVYLLWARREHPGTTCGCLGGKTPVSTTAIVRSLALAALSALYAVGTVWEFGSAPRLAVSIALITGEVLVIAVLSDELTPGVHRFSLIVAGVSRSAADRLRGQALICRRIRSQPFWQEIIRKSVYEPVFMDSWRDGRWVYAEYEATWDGKPVVIVGADYLGMRPPWVRIVIAEEHEHGLGVFGVWDSAAYARSVRVAASTTPFGGGVPAIS